jgi:hypothetical protein
MSPLILVVLTMAAIWTRALAVDVSGSWVLRLVTAGGKDAPVIDVVLKQDDERLTGKCSLQDLDDDFTISGQAKEDRVSWECFSSQLRMTFDGSIRSSGREITGSWNTSANPEGGTFIATKR